MRNADGIGLIMKNNLISFCSYKQYTKKLRWLLKITREDYHVRRFTFQNNDQKRNWKVLNGHLGKSQRNLSDHLIHNGIKITDPSDISNKLCSPGPSLWSFINQG